MLFILVKILLSFVTTKTALGSGILEFQLFSYHYLNGGLQNASLCELDSHNKFTICLSDADNQDSCFYGGKVRTRSYQSNSIIFTESLFCNQTFHVPNPWKVSFERSSPKTVSVKITVDTRVNVGSNATERRIVLKRFIPVTLDENGNHSIIEKIDNLCEAEIKFSVKFYCNNTYLIPDCARKYFSSNNNRTGHFTCNESRIVCLPGWASEKTDCITYSSSHYTSSYFFLASPPSLSASRIASFLTTEIHSSFATNNSDYSQALKTATPFFSKPTRTLSSFSILLKKVSTSQSTSELCCFYTKTISMSTTSYSPTIASSLSSVLPSLSFHESKLKERTSKIPLSRTDFRSIFISSSTISIVQPTQTTNHSQNSLKTMQLEVHSTLDFTKTNYIVMYTSNRTSIFSSESERLNNSQRISKTRLLVQISDRTEIMNVTRLKTVPSILISSPIVNVTTPNKNNDFSTGNKNSYRWLYILIGCVSILFFSTLALFITVRHNRNRKRERKILAQYRAADTSADSTEEIKSTDDVCTEEGAQVPVLTPVESPEYLDSDAFHIPMQEINGQTYMSVTEKGSFKPRYIPVTEL